MKQYAVVINNEEIHRGQILADAARVWDAATFSGPSPVGGIIVQEWRGSTMVRDGWIVHVRENGAVYISPNIADKES